METLEHFFEYVALAIDLVGICMILWGFSLSFKDWLMLEMGKRGKKWDFFRAPG